MTLIGAFRIVLVFIRWKEIVILGIDKLGVWDLCMAVTFGGSE
jgi:hypothetical protein